jgi:predicted DCC family thiol-disulfide oxidoreductase YuxK
MVLLTTQLKIGEAAMPPILFFDGHCNFCNAVVDFTIRHEKGPIVHFSALQSTFAKEFFEREKINIATLDTAYFYDKKILWTKADVAMAISHFLKWPYSSIKLLKYLPTKWRIKSYDIFAKKRYSLFGRAEVCRFYSINERARFLE